MTFGELIDVLGKRLGVEIEDAGGASALEIDGETVILQDAGELLLICAEIGELPEDGKDALLASAMKANFLYQGTGGSTLALDPSAGRLVVQKYNWLERLDPETVFDTLERFADTAAAWRRILADYRSGAVRPETSAPPIGSEPLLQV